MRSTRAIFFSPDTLGLGHLRRTVLLCEGVCAHTPECSALIITGSPMAHGLCNASCLDYVKIPSVRKLDNEKYASRKVRMPFDEILRLRQDLIFDTVAAFQPDFFFVDNAPLGVKGELRRTLEYIRARLPYTRTFLNLRDVLDDPLRIVPLWLEKGLLSAVARFYSRVMVYGSRAVFDLPAEYDWPQEIREKTRYCGYIPRPSDSGRAAELRRRACPAAERLVLVTVGGGSDGAGVVEAYLRALPLIERDAPVHSVVLSGPEMNSATALEFAARLAGAARVTLMEFSEDSLAYMAAADLVVSMGGYNTLSEILWLRKRAVVVPRVWPRTEQLIRAQRLEHMGLLRMIHPNELTPELLAREVMEGLRARAPLPDARLPFSAIELLVAELGSVARQPQSAFAGVREARV